MLEVSSSKTLLSIDFRNPEGEKQIIETRLLIKEQNQSWKTLSYVWNEEQTDAFVNIIGGETLVSWIDDKGKSQKIKLCNSQSNPVQKLSYVG